MDQVDEACGLVFCFLWNWKMNNASEEELNSYLSPNPINWSHVQASVWLMSNTLGTRTQSCSHPSVMASGRADKGGQRSEGVRESKLYRDLFRHTQRFHETNHPRLQMEAVCWAIRLSAKKNFATQKLLWICTFQHVCAYICWQPVLLQQPNVKK